MPVKPSAAAISAAHKHMRAHKDDEVAWARAIRSECQCSLLEAREAVCYVSLFRDIENASTVKELRDCLMRLAVKTYA